MSLVAEKVSDLHEARWVGSARSAEGKDYYDSKGKKLGVNAKARGACLHSFEVYLSNETTLLIQG